MASSVRNVYSSIFTPTEIISSHLQDTLPFKTNQGFSTEKRVIHVFPLQGKEAVNRLKNICLTPLATRTISVIFSNIQSVSRPILSNRRNPFLKEIINVLPGEIAITNAKYPKPILKTYAPGQQVICGGFHPGAIPEDRTAFMTLLLTLLQIRQFFSLVEDKLPRFIDKNSEPPIQIYLV